MLEEVKVAFEEEKQKIKKRVEEVDSEKTGISDYKKKLHNENLAL